MSEEEHTFKDDQYCNRVKELEEYGIKCYDLQAQDADLMVK